MKTSRRAFLSLLLLIPFIFADGKDKKPDSSKSKMDYFAFVGTYTTKTESKGIYTFRYDASNGKVTGLRIAIETPDPSFVTIHPSGKYLYAVNEGGKASFVTSFSLDAKTGKLTQLNQVPALGEDPCYIALDHTGKYVLIANYTSGNLAVFPILPDGKLGEKTSLVQDSGTLGPNKERQEGPHAHWIETSADNHFVLAADLGLDEILIFQFDAAKGTLAPHIPPSANLKAGSGPRHAVFSPNGKFLFVVSELASTATSFAFDTKKGTLKQINSLSMLSPEFSGRNDVAEVAVHPSGRFLYVSNRGMDSIAIFGIDPKKGTLTQMGSVPTGGKEPRHFTFDPAGNFLFAENQLTDTIVVFHVDANTGQLTPTGDSLSVPSPVCLKFIPAE
ncbi:MAG TPA: lactonase family protein [Candidatus Dormibacteraeota bacterium]|jgi:6-phosphogluconolactonase|nr:lactonase family protein [Candidatus Dormibacteraeota bacterium]